MSNTSDYYTHSDLLAEFMGSVINRLLDALRPPVRPGVFLLTVSDADRPEMLERQWSFFELEFNDRSIHVLQGLSPYVNVNKIRKVGLETWPGTANLDRIRTGLEKYFDQNDLYQNGYELFISDQCQLADLHFFLILVVPLGAEGFDSALMEEPSNNGIYEGIVKVVSERIGECPAFRPPIMNEDLKTTLHRATSWFCNPYEIDNFARKSLAYVLGLSFFYYYPESETTIGRANLATIGKMIFSMLHTISVTYVEREHCVGRLILIKREEAKVNIPLNNLGRDYRLARKLIALSSNQNYLLCDHNGPYGLGVPAKGKEPVFTVAFTSHGSWEVQRDNKSLASVHSGNVSFHRGVMVASVYRKVRALFLEIFNLREVRLIIAIINRVITQEKGTILVFHRYAQSEAQRLSSRGCLTNVRFDSDNLSILDDMIAIDGALLFDLDCTCHALGIILDGRVRDESQGDRYRGARFNSACTYVDSSEENAIAIVISDDGAIDFFPKR